MMKMVGLTYFLMFITLVIHKVKADNDVNNLNCDFESDCPWSWNTSIKNGFKVYSGSEMKHRLDEYKGPEVDADNNATGHFLYLEMKTDTPELHVWSTKYSRTRTQCKLHISLNMVNMANGNFKVVAETDNTSWVVEEKPGNDKNMWERHVFNVGRIKQVFKIVLEVTPSEIYPAHLSMDNIRLVNCFPEIPNYLKCSTNAKDTTGVFRCSNDPGDYCINKTQVCDIEENCWNREDEKQGCDKVPGFARCTFEEDWCGWANAERRPIQWQKLNGLSPFKHTMGIKHDHTYGNQSGMYIYVNMSTSSTRLGATATLESPIINPPPKYHGNSSSPYYKSCFVRFFYRQHGVHSGSFSLQLTELEPNNNRSLRLLYLYGDRGDTWQRHVVEIPTTITNRYYLQFEAKKGLQARSDVALDDISMSPECFGLNVPDEVKEGYNYDTYTDFTEPTPPVQGHIDFLNHKSYVFTSCGVTGRYGPTEENCTRTYNDTNVVVNTLSDATVEGFQRWVVPETGFYTIIAKGASGGKGSEGKGSSKGAVAVGIVELRQGYVLYIVVGQQGSDACRKNFAFTQHSSCYKPQKTKPMNSFNELQKLKIMDGAGGGGGGSFVYIWKQNGRVPLVIAGGGGGLASDPSETDKSQNGQGTNDTSLKYTGEELGDSPAGAGGGWIDSNGTWREVTGGALMQGAKGGKACTDTPEEKGSGGFGGGGGGCATGGGGGGYAGGNAYSTLKSNGGGGISYVSNLSYIIHGETISGASNGAGFVIITPALRGCGCLHRCASLDEYNQRVMCICPPGHSFNSNDESCYKPAEPSINNLYIAVSIFACFLSIMIGVICISYYNSYQKRKEKQLTMKMMNGSELSRLRMGPSNMMTEYNPNYEFGGGTYTLKDLKGIPRENLRLVKPLGQGAFGEVYQGFYRHRRGDAVEMPVAVKTLPELSTSQAEMDFVMEALIMMKFNHPNIVHFIGVCFDKLPRFIVLELLAGGDLKTFLRESRPKPDRSSPLTMKDLLQCAIDVAKGCSYLEQHRFIHRDIAARNCLLTTKGPGRTVKIADFGMARDIYRADYYRKGGRAMLPIKWMPPEAFLEGIFTSKTDVWSFGVLLWEIMALGYMPYTGLANRQVMELVTSGGRLEPPSNCPSPLYAIMTKCWHPKPDERPGFLVILERLGYCLQDPEVINSPLPIFHRPPSSERDMTVMRPSPGDVDDCLQIQRASDYLVPMQELNIQDSPSTSSVEVLDEPPECWDKTFPESLSTQPLIQDKQNNVPDLLDQSNIMTHSKRKQLKGTLSLDPGALSKQPIPYVNVKVPPKSSGNNVIENTETALPFTVENATSRRLVSEA